MRLLRNLPDTELIECFHQGQEKAFDVLFCRYQKDVRNVIAHYVRDRLVTEDLSQDAFIRIYTSLKRGKYNEQGKFISWALRIVRNLCMDYLRKVAQRPASGPILQEDCLCEPTHQNADHKMAAKQRQHQLNGLIDHLPEDQKKVVYYRYFEELSFKEISTLMNTSVNTSLGRMRYGLAHLRKQVSNQRSCLWY